MGVCGSLSRIFMFGANKTNVHGLDRFLELIDEREDPDRRQRGLITGSPRSFTEEGVGADPSL